MPDNSAVAEAKKLRVEDKDKLTKEQRELLLFSALKDYTELAHHPTADNKYQEFTRTEALMILGTTYGVLASVAERAATNPNTKH